MDNKKHIEKLIRFSKDAELSNFEELALINNELEKISGVLEGVDFESLDQIKGEKGVDGKDGQNGIDGIDGKDGLPGTDGADGVDGVDGTDGVNGKDGSPDTAEQVRDKLLSLVAENRLDASAIKGLEDKVGKEDLDRAIAILDQRTQFLINKVQTSSGGASTFTALTDVPSSYSGQALKAVTVNAGETALVFTTLSGGGDALTSNPLSQFASTTSLQLKGVMSDETGSGALVFGTSPVITTPTGIVKGDVGLGSVVNADTTTTANITDSTNKRFITDAQQTVLGNTSGTNTGDQTSIVGITGTMAQFDTAVSDGNIVFQSGALGTPSSGTLTNATGLPIAGLTASTSTAIGVGSVELGHATDSTIARVSAGVISVEGVTVDTISAANTLSNKTLTAPKFADLGFIADANGNELIILDTVASAVNEVTFANAATSGSPTFSATGGDSNIGLTFTPKGTGKLVQNGPVNHGDFNVYFTEHDDGNSSTSDTIDWTLSNKHKSTLTGNCTFTFTAPNGPCNLVLKLAQDGTGSRTVTWPSAVHWSGGTAPTLTTTASKVDIITFYWDGSTFFGAFSLNFTA